MLCPHCSHETSPALAACTSCNKPLPHQRRPDVATGVLTPLPTDPNTLLEEMTRLPGGADSATMAPIQPSGTERSGDAELTRAPGGPLRTNPADGDEAPTMVTPQPAAPRPGDAVTPPLRPRSVTPTPSPMTPRTPRPPTGGTPGPGTGTGGVARGTGPLALGQDFGARYHIIRLLGQGGMGAVYQAWDQELEVAVAVKVIRPAATEDPEAARELERRFKRELLLARQVTHKNVVRIHDLGEIDGIKYITMPYLHGSDLASILKREGRIPIARALQIARQVVAGLVAAHDAGVVHRDLKPPNIMIDAEGRACIMDFGIARSVSGATGLGGMTVAGAIVGTVEYMAPEQARGEAADQRADVYAFGLILYDMLVGRRITSGAHTAVAELMERMQRPPKSVRVVDPSIPEALDRLIAGCLSPDPAARFQTTHELATELDRLDAEGQALQPLAGTRIEPPADEAITRVRMPLATRLAGISKWALVGSVLLAIAGSLFLFRDRLFTRVPQQRVVAGEARSLAILPFRNASGDATLDWLGPSLAETLRTDLGQSAHLRAVSSDRLHQILRDLRISQDASFDPATLQRLAEFSNADTVMWGQYVKFGQEIRIDATLQDLKSQRSIPLRADAPNEAGLMGAIDRLAQALRESLALSPDIIKELQATAFRPSSTSLQALRYFNEGLQLARQGEHQEAVKRFTTSILEDPEFALAYSRLGQAYATLGYDGQAEEASRKAVDLSAGLPAHERYIIQANHARIGNDNAKAIESFENLAKVAPGDPEVNFQLATLYETTGALDKARDRFATVLKSDPKYMDALLAIGRVEINRRNPQGAINYLNDALTLAINLENQEGRAAILNQVGIAYKQMDKPEEALRYYQDSLRIRETLGQKGGMAASLSEIAQVQQRLGKPDEALASFTQALKLRREIGDKRGIGNSLIDLGSLHQERGQYDEALNHFRESLQIQREVGNEAYQALCLNNMGMVYMSKGQYDDALTYFERSLQLREKVKIPAEVAETLHNLAETSAKLGQYDQALTHSQRALEVRRGAGDTRTAAIESYRVGAIFEYQGRYGAAVKSKEEAVKALRDLNDRSFWMGELLSGYGNALSLTGQLDAAQKALDEALGLARELQNQSLIAQTLAFQADRFYYAGNYAAAHSLAEQALQAATRSKDRHLILLGKVNLARLSVKAGGDQPAVAALTLLGQEAESLGLKHLAMECAISRAEGLIALQQYPRARQELDRAVSRSESLGLRGLLAKSQYLLATALRLGGQELEARRHYAQAVRLLDEIRKEERSADVLKRADLGAAYDESARWAKGA